MTERCIPPSRCFAYGCLKGLVIALLVYALTWTAFRFSGTGDLVPGAHHTVCMVIYGFGYVISNGVAARLSSTCGDGEPHDEVQAAGS
jgi:hypothetical protein